jgi:methyltransferase family protein
MQHAMGQTFARIRNERSGELFRFTIGHHQSILQKVSIYGYIKNIWPKIAAGRQKKTILQIAGPGELKRSEWARSIGEPTEFYFDCFRYFHHRLPSDLREHRSYFTSQGRGFGEDAFHVMWFLLFREFQPEDFLEIGVFRGQTLSLAALLSRMNKLPGDVCGISPFSSAGDSVSRYRSNVDYFQDTLKNFNHFRLPAPRLVRAFSTDREAEEVIASKQWEMVYIDGNHDYEVARKDWDNCSANLKMGGIIVLDDSSLMTAFRPPVFSTAGHPGPSKLAEEIDSKRFREVLRVGHNRAFQKVA